jgi:YHS domain-containing protein
MCDIIKIGNATAIVCGGKKDHECNEDAEVMEDAQGKRYFFENHEKASEFYELNWDILNICMGSVACSVCGDAAFDNAYKI